MSLFLLCAVRQHVLDWSTRTRQHAAQKGWTVWILIWLLTFKSISLFSSYLARCFLSHLHHPAISPFPGSCHFLPSSLPLSRPFPFRPLSFSLSLTPSVFFFASPFPSNCQVSCLSPLISRSHFFLFLYSWTCRPLLSLSIWTALFISLLKLLSQHNL